MMQKLKMVAVVLVTSEATAGGAMAGAGINRASGHSSTTGGLIGGGIGMTVDHF
ncbi:MAG TPA: hypothetical protein PK440_21915 [Candidatus Accumulibacter phosphatis]|nr:MAG: hypothetical protein AW07_03905 [Candidatus Accumulibacter sp. SK-11]HRL77091.1 hypothetical protein [Candidatus Accumulibacter phosphatis]HRQ97607.1 hypothetical protein [Candidatus Accumulibacter phosphatis]